MGGPVGHSPSLLLSHCAHCSSGAGGHPLAWTVRSNSSPPAPWASPSTLSGWTSYFFTSFWCSQNFLASRTVIFPHLSVIQIRGKWAAVVVGCGPKFLVSEGVWAVIPFCQRKQKLCLPCCTAKWLSWANLLIMSVTCFISLPCNYSQREELPLHIFTHIIQAWGLGLERLNLSSTFAAKMLQSTKGKNKFLFAEREFKTIY